jgi:hypothetical protein
MTEARPCPRCGRPVPDDAPQRLCIAAVIDASGTTRDHACDPGTGADPDETTGRSGGDPDPDGAAADPSAIRSFGDYEVYEELGHGGLGVGRLNLLRLE